MIKIGNNIRFGNSIVVVENVHNNNYLIRNIETNDITWISHKQLLENIEKINFKRQFLSESVNKSLTFSNQYVSVNLLEHNNKTIIGIKTNTNKFTKIYECSLSKALYDFNKHFNYYNELTPHKLNKYGFKKTAL